MTGYGTGNSKLCRGLPRAALCETNAQIAGSACPAIARRWWTVERCRMQDRAPSTNGAGV